ncbi:MAG: ABC transporter ATP-binding protein [Candidatus Fervidibacter sp.]|uniref:ABC transporter ATP-binding protein n=1 Tax=Candidatus Fervidibacter sp. TaxID=3100871 RepID=UPI00404AFE68
MGYSSHGAAFVTPLTDSVPLQSPVAISVKHLTKRYGKLVAVKDVSFEIRRGKMAALSGPNGAGKTTILKCLLGMLPFEGEAKVNGLDVQFEGKRVLQLVGYVPQEIRFHSDLMVRETVNFYARLRKVKAEQAERILNEWGLLEIADKPIRTLSGGMKQRLAIALASLPDPPILFFG